MAENKSIDAKLAFRQALRVGKSLSGDDAALDAKIAALNKTMADAQSLLAILNANDTAATASLNTITQQLAALDANKLNRLLLPDWNVVVASNLLSILAAGNRTYTLTLAASYGVKAGDPIFVSPKTAVPAGYLVGAASAPAANQLQVQISNPLIAVGGSMSINLAVFTLRP